MVWVIAEHERLAAVLERDRADRPGAAPAAPAMERRLDDGAGQSGGDPEFAGGSQERASVERRIGGKASRAERDGSAGPCSWANKPPMDADLNQASAGRAIPEANPQSCGIFYS